MIDARTYRRLGLAAAVSGAVHAGVIAWGRIELPVPPRELPPLAVRIVSPAPHAAQRESIEPTQPKRIARVQPALPPTPRAPVRIPMLREHAVDEETETVEEAPPPETAEQVASSDPVVIATAPPSTGVTELPPLRALPQKGRITYNLVYGSDQFPVGRTVQTWKMDGTRYLLASRSETTGIVDLIRSQHRTFLSRGELTRDGLRPETFLMSRNRGRGTEEARANFDWDSARVTLEAAAGQREESLPARTQDLLSFMYQLSLDPPRAGRFRQSLTNGSRLETYDVEVLPEETIETPLGALRALPVKQVRKAGSESLELWLATEYRYLPVRIRFFDREGEVQGEQIVTEIRLSEN